MPYHLSETESLRSLLGGREAEAASLREQAREEREELVTRLLKDKGRSVLHWGSLYPPGINITSSRLKTAPALVLRHRASLIFVQYHPKKISYILWLLSML